MQTYTTDAQTRAYKEAMDALDNYKNAGTIEAYRVFMIKANNIARCATKQQIMTTPCISAELHHFMRVCIERNPRLLIEVNKRNTHIEQAYVFYKELIQTDYTEHPPLYRVWLYIEVLTRLHKNTAEITDDIINTYPPHFLSLTTEPMSTEIKEPLQQCDTDA